MSGCTGTTNDEFDPMGYFYLVRVQPAAVDHTITLQLYDPAFVATDDYCKTAPTGTFSSDNWNDYATTDANSRYLKTTASPNTFCTGDNMADTAVGADDHDVRPAVSPPTRRTRARRRRSRLHQAVPRLHLQRGDRDDASAVHHQGQPPKTHRRNPAYNKALARVFHQWVTLCTFTPTQAGDYYLQVRTNVALGGSDADQLRTATHAGELPPPGDLSSFAMYTQTGDDTSVKGGGSNRFSVRGVRRGIPARRDLGLGAGQDVDLRERDRRVADLQPDPVDARRRRADAGLQVLRHRRRGVERLAHGAAADETPGSR